jgi:hypothetical protein
MVILFSCALTYTHLPDISPVYHIRASRRKEKISEKYLQWFFPLHSGLSPPFQASWFIA